MTDKLTSLRDVPAGHPAGYQVRLESPVRPDPEIRSPALPDQLVKCAPVDSQQFADFLYGQDVIIECHRVYEALCA
jgi:hypothetical protein